MIDKEKIEGCNIIGKFMGWTIQADEIVTHADHYDHGTPIPLKRDILLQYHSSWDWLVPVCQKIKMIRPKKGTVMRHTNLYELIVDAAMEFDIQKLFSAVVNFLKWYTTLTNKEEKQ